VRQNIEGRNFSWLPLAHEFVLKEVVYILDSFEFFVINGNVFLIMVKMLAC